jgi:hypothetical protein
MFWMVWTDHLLHQDRRNMILTRARRNKEVHACQAGYVEKNNGIADVVEPGGMTLPLVYRNNNSTPTRLPRTIHPQPPKANGTARYPNSLTLTGATKITSSVGAATPSRYKGGTFRSSVRRHNNVTATKHKSTIVRFKTVLLFQTLTIKQR